MASAKQGWNILRDYYIRVIVVSYFLLYYDGNCLLHYYMLHLFISKSNTYNEGALSCYSIHAGQLISTTQINPSTMRVVSASCNHKGIYGCDWHAA